MNSESNTHTLIKDVTPDWGKPWYKVPHLLRLNLLALTVELTSAATGYDGYLMNGLQILPQWQQYFYKPNGYILGALVLAPILGTIASQYFSALIVDRFGRKKPLFISTIFVIGMIIFQTCATDFGTLFAARFLMGLFGGPSGLAAVSLVAEISYPAHRTTLTALYNTFYNLGAAVAAVTTYGCYYWPHNSTWAWRLPTLMQGFIPILSISCLYWVPESPRYLIKMGRMTQAREVLVKHHAGGNLEMAGALIDFEFAEINAAIELEKEQKKTSILEFFSSKAGFHRFGILAIMAFCIQMSGNGLVSFYLAYVLRSIGVTSSRQQLIYSLGLTIFSYGTSVIQAIYVGRFPRRKVFLTCIASMLVCFIIWTAVSWVNTNQHFAHPAMSRAVLAMIFLVGFAYSLGLNGLPFVYMTEILPFRMRATGLFLFGVQSACWTVFNGFVNPIAIEHIGTKYYTVFCCTLFLEFVLVYFFFPETSGYSLEEVAKVFGDYAEPTVEHMPDELEKGGVVQVEKAV